MELQRRGYAECFSFMGYAPIIFISAQTGYNVNKLMQLIRDVDSQNGARVPTGVLNEMLARATARMQPPSDKGRRLKIFYLTQASTRPPTFVAFVNSKQLFHFSYQRYLINQIRENFGLEHTPIRLVIFMPATLIASIYGMNFKFMPELDWTLTLGNGWNIPLGYIFAIGLMIFCSALTIWYFKYKKWL